jgi:hypothetical protein
MAYQITINGVDRTGCITAKSISISDETRDKPSLMRCNFFDRDNAGNPLLDQDIIIIKDGSKLFGGVILEIEYDRIGDSEEVLSLNCIDYTRRLDRNLVVEGYEGLTDKQIIDDIVSNYCQGEGITTTNVIEGILINKIAFNYLQPSQCFRKICELTGRSWYIDYDKDVHYFPPTTTSAPFDIDINTTSYRHLKVSKDNSDIRNRVYVRGSTYLSDFTTIKMKADGLQTVFNLPAKPHDFTMKEGGVSKTVGIKNINPPEDFDYLLNYQEKYVEVTTAAPAADTEMEFTFKYDIPILVAVEDRDSIEEVGQYEHAIFDTKIIDLDVARERAQAELSDYAAIIVDASFETNTDGFRAGQYLNINLTQFGINADYLVQKVAAKSLGGGEYVYTVQLASAKKLGIINFLIKLLEADKNSLELDPNEVVDELFTPDSEGILIDDSIVSDSLINPPFKWGQCKWGLAQWS